MDTQQNLADMGGQRSYNLPYEKDKIGLTNWKGAGRWGGDGGSRAEGRQK